MATKHIMTSRVVTLRPDDNVTDALRLMHKHHIRNLPVVDDEGSFIGLFGVRRLSRLLLPHAGRNLHRHSLADLAFLPEDKSRLAKHWKKIAAQPVSRFMEKEKHLQFCKPDTTFTHVLSMFDHSKDSSLPLIVIEGKGRKLAGIVSAWDILEGLIMPLLTESNATNKPSAGKKSKPEQSKSIKEQGC